MKKLMRAVRADDDGVALITVIGVIVVITALAIGSYAIAQQALLESENTADETRAYRVAASGLDQELATFQETGLTESYPKSGSTGDGTYEITVEEIGASRYRLVSVGVGIDGSHETVAQEFYFLNLWKMNFAGAGTQSLVTGSGKLTGSSNIVGPFYMKGDLPIQASMDVQEGPLFVYNGDIDYQQGRVGRDGVDENGNDFRVPVFCNGDTSSLVNGGVKVFVGTIDPSVPNIDTPPLTWAMLDSYAKTAQAESVDNNMGSIAKGVVPIHEAQTLSPSGSDYTSTAYTSLFSTSTRRQADTTNANYKFIGASDGEIAATKGGGTHNFTINSSTADFGWWGPTYEGSAEPTGYVSVPAYNPSPSVYATNVHDDFAWDASTRTLYIEGTVFVDGDFTIDISDVRYVGNGTIVANGDIVVNGLLRPWGTADQARQNEWALGLVTPTTISFTSQSGQMTGGNPTAAEIRERTPDIGGAFYAETGVSLVRNLLVQGSIVTGEINSPSNNLWLVTNPALPDYLPDSLPGSAGGLMTPTRWMRY